MKKGVKGLKGKLDEVFSEYIRRRSADFGGYVRCVCCGKTYHWKEIQNGHYNTRSKLSTRFDERNCHPCCVSCNVFKNGNYPAYTKYLLDNYGEKWLKELIADGEKTAKYTEKDYQDKINEYVEKLKTL